MGETERDRETDRRTGTEKTDMDSDRDALRQT